MESVTVVVPVFDGAAVLSELVARLAPVLRAATAKHELVLVNDASRDGSWDVMASLGRVNGWIRAVDLARNVGQHGALLCGTRLARGEVVVTLDDDLQHPPEEIPRLLEILGTGFDLVYGTPRAPGRGRPRDAASRAGRLLLRRSALGEHAEVASSFRAFRTRLRDEFEDAGGRFVCLDALLLRGAVRVGSVEVEHHPRRHGSSKYTAGKLVALVLGTFAASRRPPGYEIRRSVGGA